MSRIFLAFAALALLSSAAHAQVDPERRRILHFGYDRALAGPSPTGAYLFFYSNQPDFIRKGLNMRVALAPVYIDTEVGMVGAIGEHTDVGMGLAGGGFADGYSEIRQGHFFKEESFVGHGTSFNTSVYHVFNPGQMVPLSGIARIGVKLALYETDTNTQSSFEVPPDQFETMVRVGLRLGGEPPELLPPRAAEFSMWYEGRARAHPGDYGLNADRTIQPYTAQYWSRLKGTYRTDSAHRYELTIMGGGTGAVDRFSAYRLGGFLPFGSEFPLALPGYYNGELSARRYALFSGSVGMPLDPKKITSIRLLAAAANVAYAPGMGQRKPWNSSVGTSLAVELPKGVWRLELAYGYGIDAIRSGRRGAHNVTLLTQLDFDAMKGHGTKRPAPKSDRGLDWVYSLLRP